MLVCVMTRLSHAGLVENHARRSGGSRLARPAGEITLRVAVEAVEGPCAATPCVMKERACVEGRSCELHEAWEEG